VTDRAALVATAGQSNEAALLARIREAVGAGIDWIQLREKDLEASVLRDLARDALRTSRDTNTRILINDRFDVAWAAGADGVHLGESSLPVKDVVRVSHTELSEHFRIGASCHSLEGAARAAGEGADYVLFGPVFATPSKAAFGEPQGLSRLEAACHATPIPVLAIGGITEENAETCIAAGAAGIAAIRLFQHASDLHAVLSSLR
jgi:thiamine-phosphate pyrophosphorylase